MNCMGHGCVYVCMCVCILSICKASTELRLPSAFFALIESLI